MLTKNELKNCPMFLSIYTIPNAVPKLFGLTRIGTKVHAVTTNIQKESPINHTGIIP